MHRRRFLAAVPAGALFAGCTDLVTPGPTRPTEVVAVDFETDVDTDASWGDDPIVTADREDATVVVEGVGEYGCGGLGHEPVAYDAESATLRVAVEQDSAGASNCDDDLAAESYRLTVTFDEGVPARIEASHPIQEETVVEPD